MAKNCMGVQWYSSGRSRIQGISWFWKKHSKNVPIIMAYAAVAQLDRVLGYEPRGRGFDSCQPHQNDKPQSCKVLRLVRWCRPSLPGASAERWVSGRSAGLG